MFIEGTLWFGKKPVIINEDQISYVFQSTRGNAEVVLNNGVSLELDVEYGNFIALMRKVHENV